MTLRHLWLVVCTALLLHTCLSATDAATIPAATCSQVAVQAAVEMAQEGDIVTVPAGACVWQDPVTFATSLTVQGAGIDLTIITDDTAAATWAQAPLWITCAGKHIRITGFTFRDYDKQDSFGIINLRGNDNTFRFDHLKFDDINVRSIMIAGNSYGVIDHCEFLQPGGQGVWIGDSRGDPHGSTSWSEPMSYGTADAVFIEDSTFVWGGSSDGAVDCTDGARYVFRHNTVAGIMAGNHGMDSRPRSCMQMEIYDNTFAAPTHSVFLAIQSRGGSAVVFDNTITGAYNLGIGITNYRSCCYAGAACTPSPAPPHGDCDGTNPLDGNTEPIETFKGWPCKDQIGRGTLQSSQPLYEWNNTKDGADVDVTVYNNWTGCDGVDPLPEVADHVQADRDYFNDTPRPGYTPYTYPHPLTTLVFTNGFESGTTSAWSGATP